MEKEVALHGTPAGLVLYGRNTLFEALKNPSGIRKVLFSKTLSWGRLPYVLAVLKKNRIIYDFAPPGVLDGITATEKNQGVCFYLSDFRYYDFDDMLRVALEKKGALCILDGITDPYNFGAVIRSAAAFGIDGILSEKRNSAPVSDIVYKTSAGLAGSMKISSVTNINHSIDELKSSGFTVYGLSSCSPLTKGNSGGCYSSRTPPSPPFSKEELMAGNFPEHFDFPLAVVIGSEGSGIALHTAKRCNKMITIPLAKGVDSLNASVAAGIMFYEISKQAVK